MKKIWKGIKFFLCYLLITAATATGVVLFSQGNSTGNINNSNIGDSSVAEGGNSLMDIVSKVMELETARLTIDADIETPDSKVNIYLNFGLNIGSGFSSVEASGDIVLDIDGRQETMSITFVDNTAYISALNKNFCFTVDSISKAVNSALSLFDISMPDTGNIDVTALLGYMGDYKETETADGLDIELEFMGYDFALTCDKDFNLKTVTIPTINIENVALSANITLDTLEANLPITKPDKTFADLRNATRIFDQLLDIKNNGYISADIKAVYKDMALGGNFKFDFSDKLSAIFTSTGLEGITFGYIDDTLYTQIGNIKLKTTLDDITTLTNFIKTDLKQTIDNFSPELIDDVKDALSSSLDNLTNTAKSISIDNIISMLDGLTIQEDKITYITTDFTFVINFVQDNITDITITYNDFNFTLDNINLEKESITFNAEGAKDFNSVFGVAKKFVNTLNTKGVSGYINTSMQGKDITANFTLKYDDAIRSNITTTILGKDLTINTINENVYIALDGLKTWVSLKDTKVFDSIKNLLASPAATSSVNLSTIDLSIIKSLEVIPNGLELNIGDCHIKLYSNTDYLSKLVIESPAFTATLKITTYGSVTTTTPNQSEYLYLSEVVRKIENLKAFISHDNYNVKIGANGNIDDTTINGSLDVNLNKTSMTAGINLAINNQTLEAQALINDNILYAIYNGLNVELQTSNITSLKDIFTNILPNYIDINKVIKDATNVDVNKLLSTNIDINEDLILSLVPVLENISLTEKALTLSLNLAHYNESLHGVATIVITKTDIGYNATIVVSYNDITFDVVIDAKPIDSFTVTIPENTVKVQDYLDLVTTLNNTIKSKKVALDLTTTLNNEEVKLNTTIDFTDTLKVHITSNSLGSYLDAKLIGSKLYISLGDVNLSLALSEINEAINYVDGELKAVLEMFKVTLPSIKEKLESLPSDTKIDFSFDMLKDILNKITFAEDTVSYTDDTISLTLTKDNDIFTNLSVSYAGYSVTGTIAETNEIISIEGTSYITLANLMENVKAVVNSVNTRAFTTSFTLASSTDSLNGTLKLSYINDVLLLQVNATIYEQAIEAIYYNKTIYITIKDVKLKVSYAERYELATYLNNKFGLNINVDAIEDKIEALLPKTSNKPFSLKDIAIPSGLTDIYVTASTMGATYNGYTIALENALTNDKDFLSKIKVSSSDFTITLNNIVWGGAITPPTDSSYATYRAFDSYFDEIERLINASKDTTTDQYILTGSATLYKSNEKETYKDSTDKLAFSFEELKFDATTNANLFTGYLSATGAGSLYNDYLAGYDHNLYADFDGDFIYLNYNNLKAKFSKKSNSEFITSLKSIVTNYLNDLSFTNDILKVFDMIKFDAEGNLLFKPIDFNEIFKDVKKYIPMLKTLRLNSDSSIDIGIDISSLVPTFTEEILLKVSQNDSKKLSINVSGLKLDTDLYLDFNIFVDTTTAFNVEPTGSYMDMTSIGKFINSLDKTAQTTTKDNKKYNLNLSGELAINAKLIGIPINKPVPFNAQLVLDRTTAPLKVEAKIFMDIPEIALLNGTKDIKTTIYITDKLEGEPIMYIDRTGNVSRTKYRLSELGSNLINIISDITAIDAGTLESIMTMDIKYIDGPTKAENVLKSYVSLPNATGRNFTIGLDLRQLTLMDMIVGYSDDNKTEISLNTNKQNILTTINVNNIKLAPISGVNILAGAKIDLTALSTAFDFTTEINSLDPTVFGGWSDGGFLLDFDEDGGSIVPNKIVKLGRSVELPIPTKETQEGNYLYVYKFLGWTRTDQTNGPLYNGTFVMTEEKNIAFKANWELKQTYTKQSLTFVDTIFETTNVVTSYNGYDITGDENLPTLTIGEEKDKDYVIEGKTVTYKFLGWKYGTIIDGSIVYGEDYIPGVMPDENKTVYAVWTPIREIYQRKLQIIDPDAEGYLYDDYFEEGTAIDIKSLVVNHSTTQWYTTATYEEGSEITNALPTTMPQDNLVIYVRNVYTLNLISSYGNEDNKNVTITLPQRTDISSLIPVQENYETTIYDISGNPDKLYTYIFLEYILNSNSEITLSDKVANGLMPNSNMSFVASWDVTPYEYLKLTFSVGWVKPGAWTNNGNVVKGYEPTPVADRYVLPGSVLSGTTLTKVTSMLDPTKTATETISTTTRYTYKFIFTGTYDFKACNWNTTGLVNHNVKSFDTITTTITEDTSFFVEWKAA